MISFIGLSESSNLDQPIFLKKLSSDRELDDNPDVIKYQRVDTEKRYSGPFLYQYHWTNQEANHQILSQIHNVEQSLTNYEKQVNHMKNGVKDAYKILNDHRREISKSFGSLNHHPHQPSYNRPYYSNQSPSAGMYRK